MTLLPPRRSTLERTERALRTLSGSNRALLRAEDESALLQEICRVVVEVAGYGLAVVGRAEHDEERSISVQAVLHAGPSGLGFAGLTWADNEQGRSATGTAIRTAQPCLINDTAIAHPAFSDRWREVARSHGGRALLSVPLRVDGDIYGALTIGAPESDAFGEQELDILLEAAADLAFGLQTLRAHQRKRHAEAEILRLNRALQTRAAVDRAVAHASDETALLQEICRVAVDECGYRLAWVGYSEEDAPDSMRPVAHAGFEDGFLSLPRQWASTERVRRLLVQLEGGQPFVLRDMAQDLEYPYREHARQRGYGSAAFLPLHIEGAFAGALQILAAEPDAFDERELELLQATAADLAFGLGTLRMRARALAAEARILHMAHFDATTGLPNRVRLRELLTDAIVAARQGHHALALLRIELDRYQDVNQTLGEAEMDRMLREIAQRLVRTVSAAGPVARLADSEFAVVLKRGGAEPAAQLAQKILTAMHEPIELSGLLLDASASVGISLFPGHGTDADALLRRACIALDQVRGTGGSIALFKGGLDRECAKRLSLMSDLRSAIEHDELMLYCQPKLALASGNVCGAEALVRWQHPRLGVVGPSEFIALAESTGLITPLTYWVLDASLHQCYAWHEQGAGQPLSVNLSARDLRDPKLVDHISGALATWGAQADWIEFELTESALMVDPVGALDTLRRLKGLNVRLTIDDYGTGYSSLSYLQRLPVDTIKIDQSFVGDMLRNNDSATIVRSTIELAHNLHLTVVAEGVEDQPTFDQLTELGCDMAQGYCISRPLPAEQFQAWWAASGRQRIY